MTAATLVPFSQWRPLVEAAVFGIPAPSIDLAVREAAVAVAKRVQVLEDSFPVQLEEGIADYPVDLGCDLDPFAIRAVCLCDRDRLAASALPCQYGPGNVRVLDPRNLRFHPVPCTPLGVWVTVVAIPSATACQAPERLWTYHRDAVTAMALQTLHNTPGGDWYNPKLAIVQGRLAKTLMSEALIQHVGNHTDKTRQLRRTGRWV